MQQQESLTHGLIPGLRIVEGADLRAWAKQLPTLEDITNDIMTERKRDDESAAISSVKAALKEFNCALLPVVAKDDEVGVRAWMHVISYLIRDEKSQKQARSDQEHCSRYIEDVLRNFEVRFEFIRDDKEQSGFSVQLLTNW